MKPKIIADKREKNSLVIAELHDLGVEVELKHLTLSDYLISAEIAIERKTINDFINSMLNKRLLNQLRDLKQNYKCPLLIIEGIEEENLYSPSRHPNIHENAIRGMILTITTGFKIPILFTKDYKDTAVFLQLLAKRQVKPAKAISFAVKRKAFNISEQQQLIIESFPGIGPSLAKSLLKKFKSIKALANAKLKDLEKVQKLGKKKAAILKRLLEIRYH